MERGEGKIADILKRNIFTLIKLRDMRHTPQ